jgi:hypothetical protein
MESRCVCKCGKEAVGFITSSGWLCKDCFDKKMEEVKTENLLYDQAYSLLSQS